MKNLTNLIKLSLITLTILSISFILFSSLQPNLQAEQPNQTDSHTYIITSTQNNEYHAQSTTDNTGLFFTQSDLTNVNQSSMQLSEGDTILVSFDDYETITSIKLILITKEK
jgi:hypothetical protein